MWMYLFQTTASNRKYFGCVGVRKSGQPKCLTSCMEEKWKMWVGVSISFFLKETIFQVFINIIFSHGSQSCARLQLHWNWFKSPIQFYFCDVQYRLSHYRQSMWLSYMHLKHVSFKLTNIRFPQKIQNTWLHN